MHENIVRAYTNYNQSESTDWSNNEKYLCSFACGLISFLPFTTHPVTLKISTFQLASFDSTLTSLVDHYTIMILNNYMVD